MLFVKAGVNTAHDAGVFIDGGGSRYHKHVVPVYISLYVPYSGKFWMSNFWITAKWNISNGFIFKFPARPPREKLRCPL